MHKRILTTILIICLLSAGLAYAAAPTDLYVYQYNGDKDSVTYNIDFQWRYKADDSLVTGNNNTAPLHLYKLVNGNDTFYAYCCDFEIGIINSLYKRINLEDSTYFTADEAAHIRGIMQHGYWYDWTDEDLAAAATAAGITDLTKEQAMAATQLAIWNYANFTNNDKYPDIVDSGTTNLNTNVAAFRDYLLTKTAVPASPSNTIFTNEAVSVKLAFTENYETSYDVTVKFKLVSSVTGDLTLTATLGSETKTFDLNTFLPDEDGYYSITFNNVQDYEVELIVTGTQTVNDVYFYEPKVEEVAVASADSLTSSVRTQSQNLVGWAQGETPVFASSTIPFTLGNKTVNLIKYAEGTEIPLAGATFNLYAKQDSTYILVKSNLITNAEGKITVTGLTDEYEYYFKEIAAPTGYETSPEYYAAEEKTIIFNSPIPSYTPPASHTIAKTVNKIWNDAGNETNRPESVEVQLYKDGEAYREPITLNAENDWTYTWYGLSQYGQYSVVELTQIENYISSVDGFTITNTYEEPAEVLPEGPVSEPPIETPDKPEPSTETSDEPESAVVPKTGDNMYYWLGLLVLSTLGCGIVIKMKKEM